MNREYYMENNPNCEETYATFRVIGDSLSPEILTKNFGINPSFAHKKEEQYKSLYGVFKRRTGVWALSSENQVYSTSTERHIAYLLDALEPSVIEIKKLVACVGIEVDFHCYWLSATGHGGPVLSNHLLSRLIPLCNTLDFDFYGPYEEEF